MEDARGRSWRTVNEAFMSTAEKKQLRSDSAISVFFGRLSEQRLRFSLQRFCLFSVFFLSFFPSVNDSHSPTSERQQKEEKTSKSARNDRKKESFFRDVLGSVALVRDCV